MSQIKCVRVSKTSFKVWVLYGPVDQALKTSTQAEAVKVIPIKVPVHDEMLDVELWVNTEEAVVAMDSTDELNPPAQLILQQVELRKQGINALDLLSSGAGLPSLPIIKGVAILTGAGASDFPQEHIECTLAALTGQNE